MEAKKIAIIGAGPRGLSVLEKIALKGLALNRISEVIVIDDTELGAGRIWRTDQNPLLLMNTITGQVTMYSGDRDEGPWCPGAGPNLYEWLQQSGVEAWMMLGPNDFAPRVAYGLYLNDFYNAIITQLEQSTNVRQILDHVNAVTKDGTTYTLAFSSGTHIEGVTDIVLAIGHQRAEIADWERPLIDFAHDNNCRFIRGDSAEDMPIEEVTPDATVGIIGMGLGFLDIVSLLTEGRGGQFKQKSDRLTYIPSGREPKIVSGSRSGLPILARGRNQKSIGSVDRPIFFSKDAVEQLKLDALLWRGSAQLEFNRDILPLLKAEMEHVYYVTHIQQRDGNKAANAFNHEHKKARKPHEPIDVQILAKYGVEDVEPLNIWRIARPFHGRTFESEKTYREVLEKLLTEDVCEANKGNLTSPIKAALDVIRESRDVIRSVVEYGGLTPESFENEFYGDFLPVASLVSTGPPAFRIEQLLALMQAGVLKIAGPQAQFDCDEATGKSRVHSEHIVGGEWFVDTLIDSRIPTPGFSETKSSIMKSLGRQGFAREYRNDSPNRTRSKTGGIDVTPAPFQIVDNQGKALPGVYCLGIPTEKPRWFTQVGSATPNVSSRFNLDAISIAETIVDGTINEAVSVSKTKEVVV